MPDLNIRQMAHYHRQRQKLWHAGASPWTLADYSNALAGEVGEICNKIKKIRRIELGHSGGQLRNQPREVGPLIEELRGELGGAFVYLLSLADALCVDLTDAIREEFNKVSDEQGFAVKMPTRPEADPVEQAARALNTIDAMDGAAVMVTLSSWNALQHALAERTS